MTVDGHSLQFNFTTKKPKMMLTHGDTLIDDEKLIRGIIEDTVVFQRGFDIVFPEGFEEKQTETEQKTQDEAEPDQMADEIIELGKKLGKEEKIKNFLDTSKVKTVTELSESQKKGLLSVLRNMEKEADTPEPDERLDTIEKYLDEEPEQEVIKLEPKIKIQNSIVDLKPRLSEIGKIKIGGKGEEKTSAQGRNRS